jgi:hypothetical protein
MKFAEYLIENDKQYKNAINIEEALKLIKKHCSIMDISKPYWRGTKDGGDAYIIDGSKGYRKSYDTGNYYTLLIDHFTKPGNPLRSKSIVCINNPGKTYAKRYADMHMGNCYAVFPYDNAKIGFVGAQDMWDVNANIGKLTYSLNKLNKIYKACNLNDDSYGEFVKGIKTILQKDKVDINENMIHRIFESDVNNVEPYLKHAYNDSLNFKYGTTKTIDNNTESEIWISGNCVLIRYDIWKDIQQTLK